MKTKRILALVLMTAMLPVGAPAATYDPIYVTSNGAPAPATLTPSSPVRSSTAPHP